MVTYSFRVREHIRDDMYRNYFVEVELTDEEARRINNDDSKYSKCSALISAKLGLKLEAQGFPQKVESQKIIQKNSDKKQITKEGSFFRPIWAIPFKLVWWIVKLPFKLVVLIFKM